MLENLVMVKSDSDKIFSAFARKLNKILPDNGAWRSVNTREQDWADYLHSVKGLEYIRKLSTVSSTVDHLLDAINESFLERFVIRDPLDIHNNFILIEKDLAQKILVLGDLP